MVRMWKGKEREAGTETYTFRQPANTATTTKHSDEVVSVTGMGVIRLALPFTKLGPHNKGKPCVQSV